MSIAMLNHWSMSNSSETSHKKWWIHVGFSWFSWWSPIKMAGECWFHSHSLAIFRVKTSPFWLQPVEQREARGVFLSKSKDSHGSTLWLCLTGCYWTWPSWNSGFSHEWHGGSFQFAILTQPEGKWILNSGISSLWWNNPDFDGGCNGMI